MQKKYIIGFEPITRPLQVEVTILTITLYINNYSEELNNLHIQKDHLYHDQLFYFLNEKNHLYVLNNLHTLLLIFQ